MPNLLILKTALDIAIEGYFQKDTIKGTHAAFDVKENKITYEVILKEAEPTK